MGMTVDSEALYQRLQTWKDFYCSVEDVTKWNCKGCEYFYFKENCIPRCLKKEIRDWVLYKQGENA